MKRVVAGGTIILGLVILAIWLHLAWRGGPGTGPGSGASSPSSPPVPTVRPLDASVAYGSPEARGSVEFALFQEMLRAQQEAWSEAVARVPVESVGLLPTAPSVVLDKGSAKRTRVAEVRFAAMLEEISRAHGMTRSETEEIFRRGRAEGWEATP